MHRRYLIWLIGRDEMIRVEVKGLKNIADFESRLDGGIGAIKYGEGPAHRSYLLARNVSHYHMEEL